MISRLAPAVARRGVALSTLILAVSMALTVSLLAGRSPSVGDEPAVVPDFPFENAAGAILHLSDFRGRMVLLNLWATWCIPCRREMPMLDRLQAQLGGPDFEVVALSIDPGGVGAVERFYAEVGIANLAIYVDVSAASRMAVRPVGLPVTLLIDPEGREITGVIGPAEWDSPEMIAMIRGHLESQATGAAGGTPTTILANP